VYTVEITASYADGTAATDEFSYTLTPCVMTPVAITDVSYDIYSGSSTFTVDAFTLSGGHCPDPTYTAVESGDVTLPTFLTNFDGPTLTFTIESDLNTDQGPYVIELTGEYVDGTTASITFNLELVPCVITVVPLDD